MEGFHNSVLITGDKFSFGINLSIFHNFNHQISYFPGVENKMRLIGILYSITSCLNYTKLYIRGLIHLNYIFNIPFKVSPKAKAIINEGFIFRFHDGIYSKILPTLLEMFFKHFSWKSAFSIEIGINDAFFNFPGDSSKHLV